MLEVKMEQPTMWIGTELICSKALTCLSVPYPQCGILLQGLNKYIKKFEKKNVTHL